MCKLKKLSSLLWLVLFCLLASLTQPQAHAQEPTATEPSQPAEIQPAMQQFLDSLPTEWIEQASQYLLPGEILVGVRSDQANQLSAAGVSSELSMQLIDFQEYPATDTQPALTIQRWRVAEGSEWMTIAALQGNPAIEFAEPNWIVRAAELIDTSDTSNLYGTIPVSVVENPYTISDSLYRNEQWYLQRINASRALSLMSNPQYDLAPKRQIVVAVLDSGIDAGSPEFSGRVRDGYDYVNTGQDPNVANCTKPAGSQPVTTDDYGHGSHVAGLLGAGLNNGAGIASLGGAIVQIEPIKVLDSAGSGSISDVAAAIRYVAQCLAANIINLSLEVSASFINGNPDLNRTFQTAVQFADQRNVLQIAAAGNNPNASLTPYPAAYAEVMGVTALTYDNLKASYSTAGAGVDLAAPGGETDPNRPKIYSTWSRQASSKCSSGYIVLNGGAYCYDVGTSMATPLVASVAALVWSAQPALTSDEVANLLKQTATPLPLPPQQVGSGIVDAAAALRKLIPAKLEISPTGFRYELAAGASPFAVGVRFDNPSSNTVTWTASLANPSPWLTINGAISGTLSNTARYGGSSFLTMVISPTFLGPGFYAESLKVVGRLPNGQQQILNIPLSLAIGNKFKLNYLPLVANNSGNPPPAPATIAIAYRWETPAKPDDRSSFTLLDQQSLGLSLPPTFTFPLAGSNFADFRIYSEGFVTFPSSASDAFDATQNRCLPNAQVPGQAIYGWWTNLNPSVAGSEVSTFLVGSDRFVIEFKNVPTATSPVYKVSFQIVLYRNGDIGLNYLDLPTFVGATGTISIGIEGKDGRFGYLVACNAPNDPPGKRIIGVLPEARQSFLIKASYIY